MATKDWQDGNDNWNTSGDWNQVGAPEEGDDVTISQGNPQVTADDGTVQSVTIATSGQLTLQNGGMLATAAAFDNSGTTNVGDSNDSAGNKLSVGGTLTNAGTLEIGTFFQPGVNEVDAAALVNTGTINLSGNSTAGTVNQSTLTVNGAAGFGMDGVVTGSVNLSGDASLQFDSGSVTSIASGAQLSLDGAQSRVSIGAATTNNALTGLTSNDGSFELASGATVTTAAGTDFTNSGTTNVGDFNDSSGSTFAVGGTLTNAGTLDIGTFFQSGVNEVDAAALVNTGTINLNGNSAAGTANQSTLDIAGAAGFGTAGTVTGTVNLSGDALLQFGSGGITSIASGAQLSLNGAQSRLSIGAGTTNNALTALTSNDGTFELASGATVTTADGTDFTNSGTTNVGDFNDSAGSTFAVGGTLTNAGTLDIGTSFQPGLNEVDAAALVNTGTINLNGNSTAGTTDQSTLDVAGAAGFGTAGTVTGTVNLSGDALLQFGSGGITSIASGAQLSLNGAQSRLSIGAGTTNNALTALTSNDGTFELASGATVTTADGTDFTNSGTTNVGDFNDSAGSTFAVGGTLTNAGTLDIGTSFQPGLNEVDAAALVNTGTINLGGNATAGTANQSTLDIAGAAGFGTAGTVTGTVNLSGDALLQFGSGGITSIASGAQLSLNGAQSRVSIGAGTTNNALTGFTSNAGTFDLVGGATVTTAAGTDFTNSGLTNVGDSNDSAGNTLSVGGTLTNTNTLDIGIFFQSGLNEVDAAALVNTGTINLNGNSNAGTANQSTLDIAGAAGFGTAGTVTGTVNLSGDALLQFGSGGITSIASGAQLSLNGAQSRVSIGAGTTNNALTGLTSNDGTFDLVGGDTVTTAAGTDFTNSGLTNVGDSNDSAGSTFAVGGTLTNAGTLDIGTSFQPGLNEVDAAALVNTGTINLGGNATAGTANQSTLDIAGAAGFGTAGTVTGTVNLSGDALLQFGSGGITSIASGAQLSLNGAQSRVSIGAGTTNNALTGFTSNAGTFDLVGGATVTTAAGTDFTNSGLTNVGDSNDSAGNTLSVGGTLTNTNTLDIGVFFQSGLNEVDAAALVNTGTINLNGNSTAGTTDQSTLDVAGAAGFGTAGTVTGTVNLSGDALLQFGSGGITSIASGAQLSLNGAQSRLSIGAGTTNNALTALTSNAGTFDLVGGATVTTAAGTDFTNSGLTNVGDSNDSAGNTLSVGGTLTNTNTLDIGIFFQSGLNELDAAALVNTGTINLSGSSATNTGALTITGAAVNDAVISANAYGRIAVGSFRQDATGSLSLQIDGTAAGQFSTLSTIGAVALQGGALVVNDGLGLAAGETFNIATFAPGELTGAFQALRDGGASGDGSEVTIGNGLVLGAVYNNATGNIQLQVVAAPTTTTDNFTAASGDFDTAANWDQGVPTFYSDVVIGATASANVTLSNDATINSLALDAIGQLQLTGSASLTVGSDVTVQTGGTLSTATSGGAFNVAGNVTDGGTLEVGNGVIDGNFIDNGTLEIKSGTFKIEGTITGVGNIIVDVGATLVIDNANVTPSIVDNGTIEVTKAVTFGQNLTGSGSLVIDAKADAELTGTGPATIAFSGVGGGIKLDAPASAQSSSISNFQAGDTINFANAAATAVSIVNDPTLQVTTTDGTTLAYNLVGSSLDGDSLSFYGNGTGGSQATGVSTPDSGGYDTGVASGTGTDYAPALGTSYFLIAGNGGGALNIGGQLTHDGTNWTLAFPTIPTGQTVIPFSLTAINRNQSSDGITVTYKLISDGGDTTQIGGSDTISNILPGGSAIDAAGNPGLGPELQVQNGNPTVYEVDSVSSSGAVLPTETLTIVVGAVGGTGGSNGGSGAGGDPGELDPTGGGGGGGATGFSWGDPHLGTYDGVAYDFQQVGEFVLTKSTVAGDNFQVQIRTAPWYSSASVAVTTQVGIALGSDDVTIDLNRADTLEVDGNAVNLTASSPVDTLAGGTIRLIAPNTYEISSIHGETVDVSRYASYLSVTSVSLGVNFPQGHTVGLLGTDTGVAANDFQTANGTILTQPISLADLYGVFGDSWRITDATSLLNYDPGQSTATFTDLNFPGDAVSLADIPASVLANATAAVDAAGITDPGLRANAIYDYALTNDADFITGGKNLQQEGQSPSQALDPTKPPAAPGLGIQAAVSSVTESTSGTTLVSYTVYSTAPVAQDTVVDYAVVSPDASFLGAASFGGTLPSGQVTIAAGSSSATISIAVASTALGASASELLRVEITDAAGAPVLTPTADVSVNNGTVTIGTHAIPSFAEISGGGTLTQSGNNYTLDLGSVTEGSTTAVDMAVINSALANANQLGGTFATSGSGFTITGTEPFSGIAGGQIQAGIDIVADTSGLGAHSETLTLHPTEGNASGFSGALSDITLTITDLTTPCYCRSTLILTDRGEKPVEELAIGDRVNTMSGAVRPIKWIGRRSYGGRFALGQKDILPICFKAGCLDEGVPRRDLWISPHHAMYLEGVLIEAKDLVNGVSIVQAERVEQVEYFHIELDSHDVIIAEGALSESFIDDDSRGMFHNAHEYDALYPDVQRALARYCAPRRGDGYEVETARHRIDVRAGLRSVNVEAKLELRGYVDTVSSRHIAGWAQNPAHPEAPVCLDIFAGGRLIGRTLANCYRDDLVQAGLGSGHHGFEFTPPSGLDFAPWAVKVCRSLDGLALDISNIPRQSMAPPVPRISRLRKSRGVNMAS